MIVIMNQTIDGYYIELYIGILLEDVRPKDGSQSPNVPALLLK